jgi:hypothetical protein
LPHNNTSLIELNSTIFCTFNELTCLDLTSRSALGIILGCGVGTHLYPLTKIEKKQLLFVSNCIISNISMICVLTQLKFVSLNNNLSWAYVRNMGRYKDKGIKTLTYRGCVKPLNLWGDFDALAWNLLNL